jgi:hypothetical protein
VYAFRRSIGYQVCRSGIDPLCDSLEVPKLEDKDNEEERKQEQERIDNAEPLTEEEMVWCLGLLSHSSLR